MKGRVPNRKIEFPNGKRTTLERALSKLGYCSRSSARKIVAHGDVRVNGRLIRDPLALVNMDRDRIEMNGDSVGNAKKIYLMMNKVRGVVTSARDEKGRKTIYSLLVQNHPWVAPVGRLDKASEGLLFLTNDSGWAARITDPASHIEKTYHAQVARVADEELLRRLVAGVREESDLLKAKRATLVRSGTKNSWIEIVLDEGKNRHIRRMFEALGIEVLRLVRIAVGPVRLGELAKGAVRELTEEERKSVTSN